MKKIITVADWAKDSLTRQEFSSTCEGYASAPEDMRISFVSPTPSTIHAGFVLSQIVETEEKYARPLNTVIFQNVDPRLESNKSIQETKGADLFIIRLVSGIYILGPNAGYNFSFVREKIDEAFTYPGINRDVQFRSRDIYARVAVYLSESLENKMELEEAHMSLIPRLQDDYIGHIDNFGNIKTTIKESIFKEKYSYGDQVKFTVDSITHKLRFVDSMFAGNRGELVIFPGSSGDLKDPYLEIGIWTDFKNQNSSSGAISFANPLPGALIKY